MLKRRKEKERQGKNEKLKRRPVVQTSPPPRRCCFPFPVPVFPSVSSWPGNGSGERSPRPPLCLGTSASSVLYPSGPPVTNVAVLQNKPNAVLEIGRLLRGINRVFTVLA